jgi:hypothetical protein
VRLRNIKKVATTILNAIRTAEDLYSEYDQAGAEKKAWVVSTLNKKFDIPFIGEKTEEKILGVLVDIVCEVWQSLEKK